jgi:hypothetical protein
MGLPGINPHIVAIRSASLDDPGWFTPKSMRGI